MNVYIYAPMGKITIHQEPASDNPCGAYSGKWESYIYIYLHSVGTTLSLIDCRNLIKFSKENNSYIRIEDLRENQPSFNVSYFKLSLLEAIYDNY